MSGAKKITVEVPEELLTKAQVQTGQGVTETVRQGLKLLAQSSTYDSLLKLKGKGNFALSWKEIKEDR